MFLDQVYFFAYASSPVHTMTLYRHAGGIFFVDSVVNLSDGFRVKFRYIFKEDQMIIKVSRLTIQPRKETTIFRTTLVITFHKYIPRTRR